MVKVIVAVPDTLMIEPTESESLAELERFCQAMIQIHAEINEVILGKAAADNNVLSNAPHTLADLTSDEWKYPYSRSTAAYPLPQLRHRHKFWASVARVDNAFGDRNLVCTCPPIESYSSSETVDMDQIRFHYYYSHRNINPTYDEKTSRPTVLLLPNEHS